MAEEDQKNIYSEYQSVFGKGPGRDILHNLMQKFGWFGTLKRGTSVEDMYRAQGHRDVIDFIFSKSQDKPIEEATMDDIERRQHPFFKGQTDVRNRFG